MFKLVAILIFAILLTSQTGNTARAQNDSLIPREEVVSWLRHAEQLVRTTECEFRCVHSISSAETIALLQAAYRNSKIFRPEDYRSAVWTEQKALGRVDNS